MLVCCWQMLIEAFEFQFYAWIIACQSRLSLRESSVLTASGLPGDRLEERYFRGAKGDTVDCQRARRVIAEMAAVIVMRKRHVVKSW